MCKTDTTPMEVSSYEQQQKRSGLYGAPICAWQRAELFGLSHLALAIAKHLARCLAQKEPGLSGSCD